MFDDKPLDQPGPGPHRVDVPGRDLQPFRHHSRLAVSPSDAKEKAPAPGAWSEGRLAFVTQGILHTPGNRGETPGTAKSNFYVGCRA